MKITSSAPGKLILFGEHASSRNRPAIVFAVTSRLKANLIPSTNSDSDILLSSESLGVKDAVYPRKKLDLVSKTISIFFEKTQCQPESLDLQIKSSIIPGFGSSAAAIATTLGVFDAYYETNLTKWELLQLAVDANYAIKGYGSGLDLGAAIYGGMIRYQKGIEPEKLPFEHLNLVIGNTRVKAPSGPIVKSVKEFEKCNATLAYDIFNQLEEIVEKAIIALKSKDNETLGALMNKNQELLRVLNVSSPILEELIDAANENDALGAKLSGAGIGDNMIALVTAETKEKIIAAINQTKGQVLSSISIDPQGLIVSKK